MRLTTNVLIYLVASTPSTTGIDFCAESKTVPTTEQSLTALGLPVMHRYVGT